MTELMKIISETEGVRTPSRKRSKKELETAVADFKKKRSAKKANRTAAAVTSVKTVKPKKSVEPKAEKPVNSIEIDRIKISANPGNTIAAGYDEATKKMHVEFRASVYEYPEIEKAEWEGFEKTFTDREIDSGSYFRKTFRGRTFRKLNLPAAAKAAPAVTEEVSE